VTASGGGTSETFDFDSRSNRVSVDGSDPTSVQVDAADRLRQDPTYAYTYDAEGNETSRTDRATAQRTEYHWNTAHQLTRVDLPDGPDVVYRYDALGRRVEVDHGAIATRYVWDGLNLREEYDGSNHLRATYVSQLTLDNTLAMTRDGISYYYGRDGLGSTTVLTGPAGGVSTRYAYSAYGKPLTSGGPENPSTFTGHQYDTSTGLYYAPLRYYAPDTGRFLSEDPIASVNAYVYASGRPNALIDPLGSEDAEEEAIFLSNDAAIVGEESAVESGAASEALGAAEEALGEAVADAGGDGVTDIELSASRYPESTGHIEEARAAGQPDELTIDRAGANARRADAMRGNPRIQGLDRDEYPPAMFEEGGSNASVKGINPSDNRGAGSTIGRLCRGLPDGSVIRIVITC
jgi:RHS repeat-associated protein